MDDTVYRLHLPEVITSCAVFNSPHSGRDYPESLRASSRLSWLQLRSSEDAFVDDLFGTAPEFGAPLLAARVPRACVDLNRAADELDPALIVGASRRTTSPRITAGLGVIPRVVAEGRVIIEGKLSFAEAEERLATYYRPYHDKLGQLLAGQRARFGQAILIDCHSMPHDAVAAAPLIWGRPPNIVLGDRFGAACDRWLIDAATDAFRDAGFTVARNAPFAGGYITQRYGRPRERIHALQIEIDRSLYMNEARIEPNGDYDAVKGMIRQVIATLSALGARPLSVAAE